MASTDFKPQLSCLNKENKINSGILLSWPVFLQAL